MSTPPHRRRLASALAALAPSSDTETLQADEIVLPDGETLTVRAAEPKDLLTLDAVMAYGFASDFDPMVSPRRPRSPPDCWGEEGAGPRARASRGHQQGPGGV